MPDALHPLVHGGAGVAAEADGHRLEVDDEAPLVVRGDQGGAVRRKILSRSFLLPRGCVIPGSSPFHATSLKKISL